MFSTQALIYEESPADKKLFTSPDNAIDAFMTDVRCDVIFTVLRDEKGIPIAYYVSPHARDSEGYSVRPPRVPDSAGVVT